MSAKKIGIRQVAAFTTDPQRTALQLKSGAKLHFEFDNKSGGVNGHTLKLSTRERDYTPESSVQATRALLAELKPVAMLGLMGTAPMKALIEAGVLSEAGVPVVGIRTGATSCNDRCSPTSSTPGPTTRRRHTRR